MAAPSCVRDETRDKTRSKTYDKTSVEERRNEEKKQHVLGNDDETNRKRKEDNIWKNRNRYDSLSTLSSSALTLSFFVAATTTLTLDH